MSDSKIKTTILIRRRGVPCLPSEGHITVNKTSLKTLQKEGGWGVSYCLRSSCEKVKNQVKFGTNNIQHIIQWTHWGFSCHFCPLHYAHHMTTLFSNGNDTPLSTMCTQHTTSCLWQPNWCLLCICGWQYLLHLDYDPNYNPWTFITVFCFYGWECRYVGDWRRYRCALGVTCVALTWLQRGVA